MAKGKGEETELKNLRWEVDKLLLERADLQLEVKDLKIRLSEAEAKAENGERLLRSAANAAMGCLAYFEKLGKENRKIVYDYSFTKDGWRKTGTRLVGGGDGQGEG